MVHLEPLVPAITKAIVDENPCLTGDPNLREPARAFVHEYMKGYGGMEAHKDRPVVFGAVTLVLDDNVADKKNGFFTQNFIECECKEGTEIVRTHVDAKAGCCILTPSHVPHGVELINRNQHRMSVNFFY